MQKILKDYTLNEEQVAWIKQLLSHRNPQCEFIEDLIYGEPSETCCGHIITDMNRDDVVGMYGGYYEKGRGFLYNPVMFGLFQEAELLDKNIIGIIPYHDERECGHCL